MSEEKRKPRVISIIALVICIAPFHSGLLAIFAILWHRIIPGAGEDFGVIGIVLIGVAALTFVFFWKFWPIAIICLALSIVTLFIERNIYLRLLPLIFFIFGICICAIFFDIVSAILSFFTG
jgi:hypothetical protein